MQVTVTDVSAQVSSSLAVSWLTAGIDVLCIAAELGLNLNWKWIISEGLLAIILILQVGL